MQNKLKVKQLKQEDIFWKSKILIAFVNDEMIIQVVQPFKCVTTVHAVGVTFSAFCRQL